MKASKHTTYGADGCYDDRFYVDVAATPSFYFEMPINISWISIRPRFFLPVGIFCFNCKKINEARLTVACIV